MSADHWRKRAATARAQANEIHDPDAKQTLLEVAENFDQLAEQADVRRKINWPHTSAEVPGKKPWHVERVE
jgi:hypothetical protein